MVQNISESQTYDGLNENTDSAPLTWNFPLLRQLPNIGNLSLITRQPNTFPSLYSQIPKPLSNFRTLAAPSENSFSKPLFLPIWPHLLGFSSPFHILAIPIFAKRELKVFHQDLNPWPSQRQVKVKPLGQLIFLANTHNSSIISYTNVAQHTIKIIIKKIHTIGTHRTRTQVLSHKPSTLNHLS